MRALLAVLVLSTTASALPQTPAPAPSPLFLEPAPLALRLEGDLHALLRDRGAQRKQHTATLQYTAGDNTGSVGVKLRTRGIFRLKTCSFPPIRIDLPSHKVNDTPFAGLDRLKLATHCQSGGLYERNLLREYALYRVFNALTDTSYRVRLAHVTYIDSAKSDTVVRYGFLIEPDAALARRVGAEVLETGQIVDVAVDPSYMTLVAMFQYLIGNTDWSVWGRHNITTLRGTAEPNTVLAVPYDFDFAGAVGAPYATPPAQLPIRSVRERLYRGYCQPDSVLQGVLARFRLAKDSMYAAVRTVPGLEERDARSILDYFDGFYHGIDNKGVVQREFVMGCRRLPR